MQVTPHRLLGFAFAGADLLMEVGADEKIAFAVGAAATLAGDAEHSLIGRTWREYVDDRDQDLIEALFISAQDGARQGPVIARLAGAEPDAPQAFAISACWLPQNREAISCALTRAEPPLAGALADGLHDRRSFETLTKNLFETVHASGQALELSFVELAGLDDLARALPQETNQALKARVAGALRAHSHGGAAAAQLDEDRYALVRPVGEASEVLTGRLARLMGLVAEVGSVKFAARAVPLKGEMSPAQIVRAIRFVLDDFIREGMSGAQAVSLQDAVSLSVRHTLDKADAFGSAVAARRFNLVYQPVVWLKNGELHHHEVLVRFGDDASPYPTIRMAEEFDLIEGLDLAVAEQVVAKLAADSNLKLAANISGRSITSPSFMKGIETLIAAEPVIKGRLMFEITESAAIEDLAVANCHIQALRGLGCMVSLDDFGAGAASLAYLQQLRLDVVKIDGRYIRELQHGGPESTFIRHLVRMCGELKVKTLAEMVEGASAEDAVRRAGVDFAQGYLYGAPASRPEPPKTAPGAAAAANSRSASRRAPAGPDDRAGKPLPLYQRIVPRKPGG